VTSARATCYLGRAALQMMFEQAAAHSHTNLMKDPAQTALGLASLAACDHLNFPLFQMREAAWSGMARELLPLSSEHLVLKNVARQLSAAVYLTTTSKPTQKELEHRKTAIAWRLWHDTRQNLHLQCICKDQMALITPQVMGTEATFLVIIPCGIMIAWLSQGDGHECRSNCVAGHHQMPARWQIAAAVH